MRISVGRKRRTENFRGADAGEGQKKRGRGGDDIPVGGITLLDRKEHDLVFGVWNINGLRSVWKKNALQQFLKNYAPDVLGLSELKIPLRKLRNVKGLKSVLENLGYQYQFWHVCDDESKGYSGVGIISRVAPERVVSGWGDYSMNGKDEEGRVMAAYFKDSIFINTYVPRSGMNSQFEEKQREFDKKIFDYRRYNAEFEAMAKADRSCGQGI